MRALLSLFAVSLTFACGSTQTSSTPPATSDQAPVDPPPGDPTPSDKPGLSAADCEAKGGRVVGDIGDGAIHRPEYRCQPSGDPPLGGIVPDPGGPVAIEGAVCCK